MGVSTFTAAGNTAKPSVEFINPKFKASDNGALSAQFKLKLHNAKGRKVEIWMYIEDDNGKWQKNSNGVSVTAKETVTPAYDNSVWSNFEIRLPHGKLCPKPGNHSYKVYCFARIGDEWLKNDVCVGSYTQNGGSASASSSSRSSSSKGNKKSNKSNTVTETCPQCDGWGSNQCFTCNGSGYCQQTILYPYAHVGYGVCYSCNGSGRFQCSLCKGKGVLERKINQQPKSNYNPGGYSGGGYSGGGYSGGGYSGNTTISCPNCGGSGRCSTCGGQGGRWADVGYYTGKEIDKWIKCSMCNGSGTCTGCHGRGTIR